MTVHPMIAPARGDADSQRAALRDSIEAKRQAEAAVNSHRTAIARGRQFVEDAEQAVAVAEQGVETARSRHAEALERAAGGGGPAPTSGAVRAARAQLLEAQDEVESASAAVGQLTGPRLVELEDDVRRCALGVVAARNGVVAPIAARLLARAGRAKRDLFLLEQVCGMLLALDNRVPELTNPTEGLRLHERAREPLIALHKDLGELLAHNRHMGGPELEKWKSWCQDLVANADAPEPELP
jgi:hypothetical protein